MRRLLIVALLLWVPLAWTQDAEESEPEQPAEEAAETDAEETVDDTVELGDLYPVEDDDEFIPSEDVAFGQSIPFPTDI